MNFGHNFGQAKEVCQEAKIELKIRYLLLDRTLYSIGIFDSTTPVTISKPKTERYHPMQAIQKRDYQHVV
jgi:hypothetical protein